MRTIIEVVFLVVVAVVAFAGGVNYKDCQWQDKLLKAEVGFFHPTTKEFTLLNEMCGECGKAH